jgi:hypothetical protein
MTQLLSDALEYAIELELLHFAVTEVECWLIKEDRVVVPAMYVEVQKTLSSRCTSVENPQLLLDDRHCVRALLDAPRHLAELVPDVRAP